MTTVVDKMDVTAAGPKPDLRSLDRLVGVWIYSGEIDGQTNYEWMEGGYFLMQRVDLVQYGHEIEGVEFAATEIDDFAPGRLGSPRNR